MSETMQTQAAWVARVLQIRADPGPALDKHALEAKLLELVKEMMVRIKADPALGGELGALAKAAREAVGTGDLATAQARIQALSVMLRGAPAPDPRRIEAARQSWEEARAIVADQAGRFGKGVEALFEDDEDEAEAAEGLDDLEDIVDTFDESGDLSAALARLAQSLDTPDAAQSLIAEARGLVSRYAGFVERNDLLKGLEGPTPFGFNFTIASSVTKAIAEVQAALAA